MSETQANVAPKYATSKDVLGAGTGATPPLVVVNGALSVRTFTFAQAMAEGLSASFTVYNYDRRGRGDSGDTPPYALEREFEDLRAVIDASGAGKVTLVGHSIGGMMMLTLCRLHPEFVRRKVNGLVFVDTTYTFPLQTASGGELLRKLQRPLIEPALHLTVWLWPLAWLTNWLSYFNGTLHLVNRLALFSPDVTRGQLDAGAWYAAKDHPGVVAKGVLAVLHWNEEQTLSQILLPARVITGSVDRLTKPEAAQEMAKRILRCDLVTIDPAGHNGPLEEGEQYARAIDDAARRFAPPIAAGI